MIWRRHLYKSDIFFGYFGYFVLDAVGMSGVPGELFPAPSAAAADYGLGSPRQRRLSSRLLTAQHREVCTYVDKKTEMLHSIKDLCTFDNLTYVLTRT